MASVQISIYNVNPQGSAGNPRSGGAQPDQQRPWLGWGSWCSLLLSWREEKLAFILISLLALCFTPIFRWADLKVKAALSKPPGFAQKNEMAFKIENLGAASGSFPRVPFGNIFPCTFSLIKNPHQLYVKCIFLLLKLQTREQIYYWIWGDKADTSEGWSSLEVPLFKGESKFAVCVEQSYTVSKN